MRDLDSFENPLLRECAAAFERRGKAIRYNTKGFAIERAVEADGRERLNVGVSARGGRPASTRFCLWSDGALWFQAAKPGVSARGGWDFQFSFSGTLGDLPPDELVSTFESGLVAVNHRGGSDVEARVLLLWSRVQPFTG